MSRKEVFDVFYCQIWKDVGDFLSQSFNYALMINVDWFQPFKHTPYSVGVIYVTVINLPCHLRHNRENIILVGIIPGPQEPSHDINTFIRPMVDELLTFWNGIQFERTWLLQTILSVFRMPAVPLNILKHALIFSHDPKPHLHNHKNL